MSHATKSVLFSVSKVQVKETYCTVTDLLPNAQYELWLTATNTTGISPASEKALHMTGSLCRTPTTHKTAIMLFTLNSSSVVSQRPRSLYLFIYLEPQTKGGFEIIKVLILSSTIASCDQGEGVH